MIKAYTIDATVTAVWTMDPAFDLEHKIDPETLRGDLRDAIEAVLATGKLEDVPTTGPILSIIAYQLTSPRDPSSWRDILKVRDGQKPTEFVIGAIPAPEMNRIEHEYDGALLYYECFKASLRDIVNGPHDVIDNRPSVPHEQRDGYQVVRGTWIDHVFTFKARSIANDIGRIACLWNQLGDLDVKN